LFFFVYAHEILLSLSIARACTLALVLYLSLVTFVLRY